MSILYMQSNFSENRRSNGRLFDSQYAVSRYLELFLR